MLQGWWRVFYFYGKKSILPYFTSLAYPRWFVQLFLNDSFLFCDTGHPACNDMLSSSERRHKFDSRLKAIKCFFLIKVVLVSVFVFLFPKFMLNCEVFRKKLL